MNGDKTLAIIGGSYLQRPLVHKAKSLGMSTICFAWDKDAVCKFECDRYYPISIVEKEKILEICQKEHIDGVTSIASDVAVPTVAYIAKAMGLKGNSIETAFVCTNKYAMRNVLYQNGIPCPRFLHCSSERDIDYICDTLSFPLIVKPDDRSGSLGVTKCVSKEELRVATAIAKKVSLTGAVIVEEFIQNVQEVSVEGISSGGRYHLLAITDKVTTGAPHFVELEHHEPSLLPQKIQKKIKLIVCKAIKALGISDGASHSELMITNDGRILVTEIGARMGGDFIGSDLVMLSTGYDFLKGVIECALGTFSEPCIVSRASSGVFFASSQTTKTREMIASVKCSPNIVRMEQTSEPSSLPLTCSADRDGYILYQAEKRITSVEDL